MRKLPHAPAVLSCALALTSCASPAPKKAYADVEKTAGERLSPAPRLGGPAGELAVQERTKTLLSDGPLTADKAVELALLNNPSLGAGAQEIAAARAELAQGGILENPRFHYGVRKGGGTTGYEWSAMMNFMDLVALPLRRRLASGRYEQARLRVSQEVLSLASDVKTSFYAAQASLRRASLRRTAYDSFEAAAELLDRQRRAGNINALDHAREKAAAEQAGVELARAEAEAEQARERLAALMGAQDMASWTLDDAAPASLPVEPPLDKLEEAALRQRWDLDAARREPGILKQALNLERLGLFGAVSAGVDAEKGLDDDKRGIGPAIEFSVPLFDRRQASSARLKAEMRRSVYTVAALESHIRLEVRLARSELSAARKAAERYKAGLVPLTRRVAAETLKHYNFMLLGVYDVLRTRREEFEAQREYVDSLRDYWTAWAELERALGGKIPPELAAAPAAPQEAPKASPEKQAEPETEPSHQHHRQGDTP